LCIDSEFELVEIVKNCIQYHARNGEKVPAAAEDVAGPEVWERLTEDEKKARKATFDKDVKAIKDAAVAQGKSDTADFHKFTKKQKEEKCQFIMDTVQRDLNKEIKARLVLRLVTETEKIAVFRAIRWSFISHEQLIETSMDKDFEVARPMILEGLSSRLVNFEKSAKLGTSINLMPRTKYPPIGMPAHNNELITKKELDTYENNLNATKTTPAAQTNNPYVKRSVNTQFDTQAKEKWAATMIPNQHKPQSQYGSLAKPGHIFDERLDAQNRFAATDGFNRNTSPQPQRH
jgi:hypothetical protein